MNMNGNIFIALLHSREPVGGPLLVVAHSSNPSYAFPRERELLLCMVAVA